MHCLWCDEEMIKDLNWNNVWQLPKKEVLCTRCSDQLQRIEGPVCPQCSRSMKEEEICPDCVKWGKEAPLDRNISVYHYNDFMKEMIAKWKYRGDYILVDVFREEFVKRFRYTTHTKHSVLVPIPLSEERMKERGFNQAYALATSLNLPVAEPLTRIHSEKQSKKSRHDRMTSENPFTLHQSISEPVILIDDIYTTGRTLQHAAALLKKAGAPTVSSFTLIRG